MEQLIIEDISLDESQARVTVNAVPDIPGLAAQVFDEVAQAGVVVDMIVQNVGRDGRTNISFTMPQRDLEKSLRVIREQAEGLGCPPPRQFAAGGQAVRLRRGHEESHQRGQPPVCRVGHEGINVELISTTEVRVNVIVDGAHGEKGRSGAALLKEFADAMG